MAVKPSKWCWLESLKWSTVGHDQKPMVRIVCNCGYSTGAVVFPDDTPEARHKALTEVINDHAEHREDVTATRLMKRIKRLEDELAAKS